MVPGMILPGPRESYRSANVHRTAPGSSSFCQQGMGCANDAGLLRHGDCLAAMEAEVAVGYPSCCYPPATPHACHGCLSDTEGHGATCSYVLLCAFRHDGSAPRCRG